MAKLRRAPALFVKVVGKTINLGGAERFPKLTTYRSNVHIGHYCLIITTK